MEPIAEYRSVVFFPDGEHVLVEGREAGKPWRYFVTDVRGARARAVTPEGVAGWGFAQLVKPL